MVVSIHTLAGAALGALTGNPLGAFLTGAASHAALDAVPHTDYRTAAPGVVDGLLGLAFLTWLALVHPGGAAGTAALWGGIGGMLPDTEVAVSHLFFKGRMKMHFPSHSGLTPHPQVPPPRGVWTQAIALVLAVVLLAARLA
ncbi:hypothetical protein [Limnochorda pilosa]|uniref:Uncharacterized protein n=1 Tax=Limnochorda pilosa TaxID=1555112 RepID=A0A0K2SMY7_LIMPI|nr:hypothetical protein [Limnochorda pilosa]BAS28498.1 hypothetical protein LIP_2668 [Limnochorda pilosa]